MTTDPRAASWIDQHVAAAPLDAELAGAGDEWTLTMRRVFSHSPDCVWSMLTDPRHLVRWSPVVPDRALTSVGAAQSCEVPGQVPIDSTVLQCEAPRLLAHRWGPSILRWTLRQVPDGTQLTLEHQFAQPDQAPIYGAGWHICLAVLTALDDGLDVPRVVGPESFDHGWHDLRDRYARSLTPSTRGT